MKCSVNGCQELVLNKDEQSKQYPLCYFHAKCRDGYYGCADEYTYTEDERVFNHACSNPEDYKPVKDEPWWDVEVK